MYDVGDLMWRLTGFDAEGKSQLKKVVGTRRWIGTGGARCRSASLAEAYSVVLPQSFIRLSCIEAFREHMPRHNRAR